MLVLFIIFIILLLSFYFCLNEENTSLCITLFTFCFFCFSVIGLFIFLIIGKAVFSETNNQEMITTEEALVSFVDSKDDPVYVKYSFRWNGGSTYKYVEQNGKYPEYKEISVSKDVNIVEGNYEPVLIVHSYKANKNCSFLFGPTASLFMHDTWYEFYLPNGTFITY